MTLQNRRIGLLFLLWTAAIALSTLTTKQHYVMDVLSGFAIATVSYGMVFGLVPDSACPALSRNGAQGDPVPG